MTPLLRASHLQVSFQTGTRQVSAVRGVDFDLYPGETVGIVGESGCGKSASARALTRLLPNSASISGSVFFEGRDLLALSEPQLRLVRGRRIGMIFQDPMTSLNPSQPIGKQIVEARKQHFPQLYHPKDAEEWLQKVGIPDASVRVHDYPHMLSGGMRQRVMIALAMAPSPSLLIADEPTTSLDVTIQAQILHTLKQLQLEHQTTILLITHDWGVVAQCCDRVLVMYAGQIVEQGPVEQIFSSPRHPYTQRLLRAMPRLDRDQDQPLEVIEGVPPSLDSTPSGCAFHPRCSEAMQICALDPPLATQFAFGQRAACWRYHVPPQSCPSSPTVSEHALAP